MLLLLRRHVWLLAAALLVVAPACNLGDYEPDPTAEIDAGLDSPASLACSGACHGSGDQPAPPADTSGLTDTSYTGVGAHQAHLSTSDWHKPVECAACHTVPTEIGAPGHIDSDLPAEIVPTGMMEGTAWNGATCTNSYCHGSALTGGAATEPRWTQVDGSASECGSCHGAPPPAPHPDDADCGSCHPSMNPGDGMVIAYPELHIDGHLDVIDAAACDSCHGDAGDSAPPVDTLGNTATSARGVGAHQGHLGTSDWHKQVQCTECHRVPAGISDLGHVDTPLPAELEFGPLSAEASWDGASCSGSYCHGSTLTGGDATAPTWTLVDGSQTACGSCHGAPPPAPHPTSANCGSCHPTMTAGDGLVIAYPDLHIDGKVDVINDQACDSCHGSGGVAAPPTDTQGGTATTLRSVGAHRRHLDASTWRKPIECAECHVVPTATSAIGHVDSALPAELSFGPLAGAASWNGTTCSGTYCHGSTLTGGTSRNPAWTVVDGGQGQCGSCHGAPPPAPHPASPDCGQCHDTMTAGGGMVITAPERHIDGNLDVNTDQSCDSCHGGGGNPAPPKATGGATATTARGVGAHRNHLATSDWRKAIGCTDCHRSPGAVNAVGHIDTALPAELTFSALAGTATAWNGARCSNNYCHGSTLAGGNANAPVWNLVDGSQSDCGSCHGAPPPAPHPVGADCSQCHDTMAPGTGLVIAAPTRHIDGNLDVTTNQACDSCHGSGGDPAPPVDTTGNSATTARGVGAHQQHLGPSSLTTAMTCVTCHREPATVQSSGHIDTPAPAELTFTGRAVGTAFNGSTCTNSYCHGDTLAAGGSKTKPQWTLVNGSQSTCGSCHGAPPPPPHPAGACDTCHGEVAGPGLTITNPSKHINGLLEVSSVHPAGWSAGDQHGYDVDQHGVASCATAGCHGTALTGGASNVSCQSCHSSWQNDCTFCHGGGDNQTGAPPASVFALTARSNPEVGAHTKHVTAGTNNAAMDCTACHVKPSAALTPGHLDGVAGAELKFATLNSAATYNAGAATCGTMYCHGNGRTSAGAATWTSTTAITCVGCHGDSVTGPAMSSEHNRHVKDKKYKCSECHQTVVNINKVIIAPALHVNGVREVSMVQGGTYVSSTKRCSNIACHGDQTW